MTLKKLKELEQDLFNLRKEYLVEMSRVERSSIIQLVTFLGTKTEEKEYDNNENYYYDSVTT